MALEYKKAFDLITERVENELKKTGYTREKVASDDDNELVALFTSENVAKSLLTSESPTIVYYLATPQTIQLTPTEVRTILGECHVWADTGDVSLTYRSDTKAYIDANVSALQTADTDTRAMITQSSESAMVASKNYVTGDLLIIGNQLLMAKSNIASGSAITIGTSGNCEVVDLATVISELSARIGALE